MKYLRLFDIEDKYVDELLEDKLVLPRVVHIKEGRQNIFGEPKESFILVDEDNNLLFGDYEDNLITLDVD